MIKSADALKEYLANYKKTHSNELDSVFGLFKSDVYKLAQKLNKGEAFVYELDDFVEWKKETITQELNLDSPRFGLIKIAIDDLEEILHETDYRFFVDDNDGHWIGIK